MHSSTSHNLMQNIQLSQFGIELLTRNTAMEIQKTINLSEDRIEFDAKNVSLITHSFADELFGKIFDQLGKVEFSKKIFLKNFNDEQKSILKRIIHSHTE